MMNGLFLLDLDDNVTHIHNVDAKRIKLNDESCTDDEWFISFGSR